MARPGTDLTGCSILTVDDTPANLDVLVEMLEAAEIPCIGGHDRRAGVAGGFADEARLILLDVMMPGLDGFETCRRLRAQEESTDVPIIFLTARDDPQATKQGFEAGGDDYVTKPFNKEELLARVRTLLERAILARDLAALQEKLEQLGMGQESGQ